MANKDDRNTIIKKARAKRAFLFDVLRRLSFIERSKYHGKC